MFIKEKRIIILILLALLLLPIVIIDLSQEEVPEKLPPVELRSIMGPDKIVLPEPAGLQVINIFASWCISCHEEMPILQEISNAWQIPVHGIAWKDETEDISNFIIDYGEIFKYAGIDQSGQKLSTWGVTGVPETLVIVDGRLLLRHRGPLTPIIMRDMIAPVVIDFRRN